MIALTAPFVGLALEEALPEERQSRFLPLALGAAGYAALLLAAG